MAGRQKVPGGAYLTILNSGVYKKAGSSQGKACVKTGLTVVNFSLLHSSFSPSPLQSRAGSHVRVPRAACVHSQELGWALKRTPPFKYGDPCSDY
jgi:hypothetical protein